MRPRTRRLMLHDIPITQNHDVVPTAAEFLHKVFWLERRREALLNDSTSQLNTALWDERRASSNWAHPHNKGHSNKDEVRHFWNEQNRGAYMIVHRCVRLIPATI